MFGLLSGCIFISDMYYQLYCDKANQVKTYHSFHHFMSSKFDCSFVEINVKQYKTVILLFHTFKRLEYIWIMVLLLRTGSLPKNRENNWNLSMNVAIVLECITPLLIQTLTGGNRYHIFKLYNISNCQNRPGKGKKYPMERTLNDLYR